MTSDLEAAEQLTVALAVLGTLLPQLYASIDTLLDIPYLTEAERAQHRILLPPGYRHSYMREQ